MFLLFVGGLSLLGVLCCIAVFSVVASLVFNGVYAVIFSFLGYSHPTLAQVTANKGLNSSSDGHIHSGEKMKNEFRLKM